MYCSKCGGKIPEESTFCPHCSMPQEAADAEAEVHVEPRIIYNYPGRKLLFVASILLVSYSFLSVVLSAASTDWPEMVFFTFIEPFRAPFSSRWFPIAPLDIAIINAPVILLGVLGVLGILYRAKPARSQLLTVLSAVAGSIAVVNLGMCYFWGDYLTGFLLSSPYNVYPQTLPLALVTLLLALFLFAAIQLKKPPKAVPVVSHTNAQQSGNTNPLDRRSGGYAVLGFFFPVVGLILWLIWKDGDFPLRAHSVGKGALIGAIVEFGGGLLLMIVMLIITIVFTV